MHSQSFTTHERNGQKNHDEMSDRVPFAAPQHPEDVLLTHQPLGVPLCLVVKHT